MQKRIHQFVLEAITGLSVVQAKAKNTVYIGMAASIAASVAVLLMAVSGNKPLGDALLLSAGLLIAGIPFALLAQNYTIRLSLAKENLRIKDLFVGRRNYEISEDRAFILKEDMSQVEREFYTELTPFSIACGLAGSEPALVPPRGSSAWHALRTFDELPGVAVGFTSFGPGGASYAFAYGLPKTILRNAGELWDLGHIRKLADTDVQLLKDTIGGWRRQNKRTIAFAYASLPKDADPLTLGAESVTKNLTLLGIASLHGSREYGKSLPLDPAASLRTGIRNSLTTTITILTLGVLSYASHVLFSVPPAIGLAQIFLLKLTVEPLLSASLPWDQAVKHVSSKISSASSLWNGIAIAVSGLTSFVLYFELHAFEIAQTASTSLAHRGAVAVTLLTVAACLLITLIINRHDERSTKSAKGHNPFFALGTASAILCITIGVYATGPVIAADLGLSLTLTVMFSAIQLIRLHADRHHTREHILALLKAN